MDSCRLKRVTRALLAEAGQMTLYVPDYDDGQLLSNR
jgi:hypothetical protein